MKYDIKWIIEYLLEVSDDFDYDTKGEHQRFIDSIFKIASKCKVMKGNEIIKTKLREEERMDEIWED